MNITTILPLLDQLDEHGVDYSVTVKKGKTVERIWIRSLKTTDERYHPVLSLITTAFGRLNKEISYGAQSWSGEKDGTSLIMYAVASCKIVGYKTVEKKKTIEVETEEIETEEEPIYDCSVAE